MWQLRVEMWQVGRAWDREAKAARERKANWEERQHLDSDWHMEYQTLDDEYEMLFTRKLVKEAARLRVPVPTAPYGSDTRSDDNWEEGHYGGGWHLKPEGAKKVRAEIRAERLARSEVRVRWLNPLIGLVGAGAGLVAALAGLAAIRGCS